MPQDNLKLEAPPYISHGTFTNFISGLKETGIPSRIDKSVLEKMSGSGQAALQAALKYLGLTDPAGVPTAKMEELVNADSDDKYSQLWAAIVKDRYSFVTGGSLDLTKATGAQLEQKFRDTGIGGSTLYKAIAFFIAACKASNIKLGPHVKAPKQATLGTKRAGKKAANHKTEDRGDIDDDEEEDPSSIGERPGFVRIAIPLHGMADGSIYLPDKMTAQQWAHALKIAKFLLENFRPSTEGESS